MIVSLPQLRRTSQERSFPVTRIRPVLVTGVTPSSPDIATNGSLGAAFRSPP